MVVTDPQLTVRVEGPVFAVHQSDADPGCKMDAWNKGTHGKQRTDRPREVPPPSQVDEAAAQAQVIDFLQQLCTQRQKSPMCGNSICQDRRFLARYHAHAGSLLPLPQSGRQSTLEGIGAALEACRIMEGFKKAQAHTALADIHESIDELAYYRTHLLNV